MRSEHQQTVSRLTVFTLVVLSLSALAACAGGQSRNDILYEKETDPGLIASGRQLVVKECASCHAIDGGMKSPNPDAPPMKTVLSRYDPEMLADDLIEGIRVGHNEMPHFDFNVVATDSLIAYLKSISKTQS